MRCGGPVGDVAGGGRYWDRTSDLCRVRTAGWRFALHIAFFVMPYYTVWGIVVLAMSMLVIWALTVHGDEVAA